MPADLTKGIGKQPRSVFSKLEQELPFVTVVSDVPDMPWNVMSLRPCH
jgi:hypothetical protein